MPTTNFTTDIRQRQYDSSRNPNPSIPAAFQHTAASGKPAEPAFPGVMNREAQLQFLRWKAHPSALPTHPHALAKVKEFDTYFATPAYKAWLIADTAARRAQWRLIESDANVANATTVAISSSTTGTGSNPPPEYVPPGYNTP